MVNKVDVDVLENQCVVTEENYFSLHAESFCFYGHLQDQKVTSEMVLKYT